MDKEQNLHSLQENDTINIRAELEKYLIHWKWFALGVLLALVLAFLYLRYATPQYQASTTILIKNDKKGGISEELAAFEDLGIGGSSKNIDNEIEIIKSRKLISDVIDTLQLDVVYYIEDKPITVSFKNPERELDSIISIRITSSTSYTLFDGDGYEISKNIFGEEVKDSKIENLTFHKTSAFPTEDLEQKIKITITPLNKLIDELRKSISVSPINKKSSVLKLGLQSPVRKKAEDILDVLVEQYNSDAIKDKKEVSQKTSSFITERLENIGEELAKLDDNVKSFKNSNKITDIQSEAQLFLKTNTLW
jgi:uncharacterized protein involved in exopolysaccharide biosynthesis